MDALEQAYKLQGIYRYLRTSWRDYSEVVRMCEELDNDVDRIRHIHRIPDKDVDFYWNQLGG